MRISFCIPTYNRSPQLRQLLESVISQQGHDLDVEVVISDNCSTDDTEQVIASFVQRGMTIVYKCLPENLGFDRNMLNVVAMATSELCWLFGSDDKLEDGAFARVEQALRRYPNITGMTVGARAYDPDLAKPIAYRDNIALTFPDETLVRGRDRIVEGAGPWGLGYISAVIVRRQQWLHAVAASPIEKYCNGYVHIFVLVRLLREDSSWVFIPDSLVGWRSGNDSAASSDEFKRTRLDMVGFDQSFGDSLGRTNAVYRSTMRKVATFYIRSHFLSAKTRGASAGYWRLAIPMALSLYWRYPSFWIKTMPIALMPKPVLGAAKAAYKAGVKKLGAGVKKLGR